MNLRRLASLLAVSALLAGCGDSQDDDGASAPDVQTAPATTGGGSSSSSKADASPSADRATTQAQAVDVPAELLHGDRLADGVEFSEDSDEEQIARTVDALYDAFADGKPKRFCALVSEEGKRQMAKEVGGNTGPGVVCLQTFDPLVLRAGKTKKLNATLRAQIVAVDVDGDRATAQIDFDGEAGSIPLVKENDRWLLAATPAKP